MRFQGFSSLLLMLFYCKTQLSKTSYSLDFVCEICGFALLLRKWWTNKSKLCHDLRITFIWRPPNRTCFLKCVGSLDFPDLFAAVLPPKKETSRRLCNASGAKKKALCQGGKGLVIPSHSRIGSHTCAAAIVVNTIKKEGWNDITSNSAMVLFK